MGLHIIITGNPVDGFEFIGPFKTADDAVAYANGDQLNQFAAPRIEGEWWIAPLAAADAS